MSLTIFKNTLRRNYKLLVIFAVVMGFYLSVIISLIDPVNMKEIQELFGAMESYLDAFGISIEDMTTPLNYTASVFFSVIVMAFTMVFYVIQSNALLGKSVDDTSLSYTLSAPVTRTRLVAVTQAVLSYIFNVCAFCSDLGDRNCLFKLL